MEISLIADDRITDDKRGLLDGVSRVVDIPDLETFAKYSIKCHICCGLFFENKRNYEHFREIWFLQYDFDNGTDPETVVKVLKNQNLNYIILASKNHNKDKGDGKGVIPRFHTFIPLQSPIEDSEYYHFLIKHLAAKWNLAIDGQATDATRYFHKHREFICGYKMGFNLNPNAGEYKLPYHAKLQEEHKDEIDRSLKIEKENKESKLTVQDRLQAAKKLVSQYVGASVAGQDGDKTTFKAICYGLKCGLNGSDMTTFANWYNDTHCTPKWTTKGLQHKIKSAKKRVKSDNVYSPKYLKKLLGYTDMLTHYFGV